MERRAMITTSIRPTRALRLLALSSALCGALVLAPWHARPAAAQDAEAPAAEAAPADDAPAGAAPAAKPKKPKKVATKKAADKPAEKAAEDKPAEGKSTDSKATDAKPAAAKAVAAKAVAKTAAADGPVLMPAAVTAKAQWPNGASSVSESYGEWTVNCTRGDGGTDCVVIQSQGDRRNGKRLFSVELRVPRDGRAEGLILMPFGMEIEPGVTFKLDDRILGKGAPYTYCVNDGCLVSISLPTLATDAMRTARSLTVTATKPSAKEPPVITVPLAGFATAFERAIAYGG